MSRSRPHVAFTSTCHFHDYMQRDPWTSSCAQAGFVESVQKCGTKTPHGNTNQLPRHCGVQRDPWARSRDQTGFVVEVARSGGAITPCMVAQTSFLCTPSHSGTHGLHPATRRGLCKMTRQGAECIEDHRVLFHVMLNRHLAKGGHMCTFACRWIWP